MAERYNHPVQACLFERLTAIVHRYAHGWAETCLPVSGLAYSVEVALADDDALDESKEAAMRIFVYPLVHEIMEQLNAVGMIEAGSERAIVRMTQRVMESTTLIGNEVRRLESWSARLSKMTRAW